MIKLISTREKLWYEIWACGRYSDEMLLLAKVKSKGLAYILAQTLEDSNVYHGLEIR